jgi:hypothetical protein
MMPWLRYWCRRLLNRQLPNRIDTYQEFKSAVVEPDFREFMSDRANLRKAWRCAGSLFHFHEWVYAAHKAAIDGNWTFVDDNGDVQQVSKPEHFANSLGQKSPAFQLIRGVANASKHFTLRTPPPGRQNPPGMPSHAANTYISSASSQLGTSGASARVVDVMLQASPDDIELSGLAQQVMDMWNNLLKQRGW